ncbi:FAD-dependent oxidoreductase [Acuticoccus sp. I52.16.1]|uniref:FAD-dependent oxidoreductase n=1 Tax=Acuticoccus sp. I52.16.1 TaxID=2928472 RepID=UPI001FD0F02D|nr:FAD-dependent oxidoreductase [Acuticoccus sp. I52.16.1]UOM34229.1 FAD-dependent oxidoreductase [Acuticoccus sp. I52.16.1]
MSEHMNIPSSLPVVVIGAGPVGLAAAARLVERGLPFLVLERSAAVAAAPRAWGHVRLFSPWRYNVDAAAGALLEAAGWAGPEPEDLPTGAELTARYLEPLAAHPAIAPHLRLGADVDAVTRRGRDKMASSDREAAPLVVRWTDASGAPHRTAARAVIDASGTTDQPNPMGVDGLPVAGEAQAAAAGRIAYGLPDVCGAARGDYAGRRTLVVGSGHSAINLVLDLVRLRQDTGAGEILWALRSGGVAKLRGGGLDDQLPERGALGLAVMDAVEAGRVRLLAPFAAERIATGAAILEIDATLEEAPTRLEVDRIIVATGFRPDLAMLREVRVALDPAVEAPHRLAPLIDPNLHSCGTVPPHGAETLAHPEPDLFIVGAKSYGRAPTFLMATGYEQVRSVVAALAGDHAAAREVRLVLPETGVCSAPAAAPAEVADCGCAPTRCCGAAA